MQKGRPTASACTCSTQPTCNRASATKLWLHVNTPTSQARRPLPQPPCGETRSANRTRWAGSDAAVTAAPAKLAESGAETAPRPHQRSMSDLQPSVSAVDAVAKQDAERDPFGTSVNEISVQPPLASGNGEPAFTLPATPEHAASLVQTILLCASVMLFNHLLLQLLTFRRTCRSGKWPQLWPRSLPLSTA